MSFSFTRKTDYALVALSKLAQLAGGATSGGPTTAGAISARQIAEEFGLPQPLLMNVLKDLNRASLIASRRGAGGGYYLARPADRIYLAEVIQAIEGKVAVAPCCDEGESDEDDGPCLKCRLTDKCPITATMQRFNDLVNAFLQRMTLADMMRDDLQVNLQIRRGEAARADAADLRQTGTNGHATPPDDGTRHRLPLIETH